MNDANVESADWHGECARLPPLVVSAEVEALKADLARAAMGEAFVVLGGAPLRRMESCTPSRIVAPFKALLHCSVLIAMLRRQPIVRIAELVAPGLAGGDCRGAFMRAGLAVNFVRALIDRGFTDLRHQEWWSLEPARESEDQHAYRRVAALMGEGLEFVETWSERPSRQVARFDYRFAGEVGCVDCELAQTRRVPRRDRPYSLRMHLPMLTLSGTTYDRRLAAHLASVSNPVALCLLTSVRGAELLQILEVVDPKREAGRLVLIHEPWSAARPSALDSIIDAVRGSGRSVTWICNVSGSPVAPHAPASLRADSITARWQLAETIALHHAHGSRLGGVRLQLSIDLPGGAHDARRSLVEAAQSGLSYYAAVAAALSVTGET